MNSDQLENSIKNREEKLIEEKKKIKEQEREIFYEKVALREKTLTTLFEQFISKYDEPFQNCVYLNTVLLHAATKSYYFDIHRYKDFSGTKWANNHKQAAFTIKWIAKFKPIQIKSNTQHIDKNLLLVNSNFALFAGFSFLERSLVNAIDQGFYDQLVYITLYRHLSGKQLAAMFYALETGIKASSKIEK